MVMPKGISDCPIVQSREGQVSRKDAEVEFGHPGKREFRVDDANTLGRAQPTTGIEIAVKLRGPITQIKVSKLFRPQSKIV